MPSSRHHAEWLSLIEVAGPFLSVPVLERVFPQGLDAHDPDHVRVLRLAFDEWEEDRDSESPRPAIHREWVHFVLKETLGLPEEVLAEGQAVPSTIRAAISEHGETLRPDLVVRKPVGSGPWGVGSHLERAGSAEREVGTSQWSESSPAAAATGPPTLAGSDGGDKSYDERAPQNPRTSRLSSPHCPLSTPHSAGKPRLLVEVYPAAQNLEKPIPGRHWNQRCVFAFDDGLHFAVL